MTVFTRASGLVAFFLLLAASAQADTIYMKNGSVIRGTVVDYAGGQFTVMLDMGGSGAQSRATLVGSEIDRIEFDAAGPGGAGSGAVSGTANSGGVSSGTGAPADPAPRYEPPPADPDPVASAGDPGDSGADFPPPVTDDGGGADPAPAGDPAGRVTEVAVPAKSDWTSTQIRLRRGDRVRINATGTIQLDRSGKLTVTPVGSNIPDRNKLLTNRPTGALIAVVGDDNDDFIFVGSGTEFAAERDGLLFLSVNEGELADNSGTFTARVSVNGGQALTSSTSAPRNTGGVTTRPATQPRREEPLPSAPADTDPEPSDPSTPPPVADSGPEPAPETPAATPANAAVREANVVVPAKNDWTSTQIRVQAGARIRISATGTVQLDRAGTRTSTPAGVDLPDPTKLITNRPTGGLIAVIGDDNDDFIFVGSETEFVAQREGLLFLSVNEGELADNSGNYTVRLTIEQPRSVASR